MTDQNLTESERYVLSAMMLHVDAVWASMETIQPADMSVPRHELIAEAILELANEDAPTDVIAVIDRLERRGDLNRAGGPEYLHGLDGSAPTHSNAGWYAEQIRDAAQRRRLLGAGQLTVQLAGDPTLPWPDLYEKSRAAIDDAAIANEAKLTGQAANKAMVDAIGTTHVGYPTPWGSLTRVLTGFEPGCLYVLGARTGVGKSALALQMASELERHGHVGFFSLEMGETELRKRQLSQQMQIDSYLLKRGKRLGPREQALADRWVAENPGRILYDDASKGEATLEEIRQKVRTWSRHHKLTGVVVDYIQMIGGHLDIPLVQRIGVFSRGLKLLAKQFDVPVIVLSQLNRSLESRAVQKPNLSDLRDSGTIEQDADAVMLLSKDPDTGVLTLDVAKQRSGPTAEIPLDWQGPFVRAVEGEWGR